MSHRYEYLHQQIHVEVTGGGRWKVTLCLGNGIFRFVQKPDPQFTKTNSRFLRRRDPWSRSRLLAPDTEMVFLNAFPKWLTGPCGDIVGTLGHTDPHFIEEVHTAPTPRSN